MPKCCIFMKVTSRLVGNRQQLTARGYLVSSGPLGPGAGNWVTNHPEVTRG